VTDNCGRQDGVGSRFFTVLNSSPPPAGRAAADQTGSFLPARRAPGKLAGAGRRAQGSAPGDAASASSQEGSTRANTDPIAVRHLGREWEMVPSNAEGRRVVEVAQHGRIEIKLPQAQSGTFEGYQVTKDQRRPLPIGSSLDAGAGIFYWQPAPGFLGSFNLVFVTPDRAEVAVRVVVGPPVRMAIDRPAADEVVSAAFTVAGWAIDVASEHESGIDTVHVWAYPSDGSAPIWLGVADCGSARTDVAGLFGATFTNSSYSLSVSSLAPGSYDVVVYPHRARTNTFEGAQMVRVTIR
jgi:hypothetical protein